MASDWKNQLLILQDRDMKLRQIESELESLPKEREDCKTKIKFFETKIEDGRQKVKELEVSGKLVESEMGEVEAQIVKYKNQQLQVKKNEEYAALTHEIEMAEAKIGDFEEKELEILYALDEAKKDQENDEKNLHEQIDAEKRFLGRLDEKEANLKADIGSAKENLEQAKDGVARPTMSKYLSVGRGLKFPIMVAMRDGKCMGCHMKVSAAVESDVKLGKEITTCDNCNRILYWES
ncbi:MAG: C4-type zinc ribbon domain-containing protein [Verrucomicrobiota bacterium]